jgi:hypothetical protein
VSTPSSSTDEPPPRSRDLRDSTLGRIAIIVVVLGIAGISARSCGGAGGDPLTRAEAVDAARAVAVVEGKNVQIRYLNQGIPPRGTWIVSFYDGPVEDPVAIQTILVDAATGEIVDDGL